SCACGTMTGTFRSEPWIQLVSDASRKRSDRARFAEASLNGGIFMALHPLAGNPAPANLLIDVARLERDYYERRPDVSDPTQLVSFGTSGHRGSPLDGTFTEAHILAITQAIVEHRRAHGIDGPLFPPQDTHPPPP